MMDEHQDQPTAAPTRKIAAVGIGAAVSAVVIGVAVWLGAPQPPAGLEAGLAGLVSFLAGYFTRENAPTDPA